ncbi:MAG: twin-arginine translocase TatA/TatE family subunit [Planctomycetota bacterium]
MEFAALTVVAWGGFGPLELTVILVVALLLFGKRLPEVMRSMGRGVVEFKKGIRGIEDDIEQESKETRRLDATRQEDASRKPAAKE